MRSPFEVIGDAVGECLTRPEIEDVVALLERAADRAAASCDDDDVEQLQELAEELRRGELAGRE